MLKMEMDDPLSSSLCACGEININNRNKKKKKKRKFKDGILNTLQKHKNPKTEKQEEEEEDVIFNNNNNIIQLPDIKLLQDLQNMRKHHILNNHSPKQDSIMSLSDNDNDNDDSNNEKQQLKTYPYDHGRGNSTSSVNWSGATSSTATTNFYPCPSFEDEFTTTTISSSGYQQTKQSEEEAPTSMEDFLFCSNGNEIGTNNHFVLSSGRWDINHQDTQQGTHEKLTIDKEFEQYFSMLML